MCNLSSPRQAANGAANGIHIQRKVGQSWSLDNMEIDLMGLFICGSNINKHSTTEVWGAMLEDINSGAVYCDIVSNYGMKAVIIMLKKLSLIRGWPSKITSDSGSHLESVQANYHLGGQI